MADQNEVMVAFEILLEEIEAVVGGFHQEGAGALNRGDYRAAREMIDQAEKVTAFREQVKELKREWQKSFSQRVRRIAADKGLTGIQTKRLERGLRTPQESYRRPILEALAELGGSATVGEVLDRVYEKVKDRLTEYDRQPLPSSGDVRWRNATMWCRCDMVKEGLLATESPRGIWEITQAGRAELSRSREIEE